MKKELTILFHRPTPWDSEVTCSTKVFSRYFNDGGFKVTYLENPLDIVHLLKWKGYFNTWKKSPRYINGIWVINPFTLVPTRDFLPFNSYSAIKYSYKSCIPSIRTLLKTGGIADPDIIWAARPGSSVLKELFPDATLIMQVVDYYPAFRGEYIKKIEKIDYLSADQVFLIGHALWDYVVRELGIPEEKVSVLGQGVTLSRYTSDIPCPEDIKHISGPKAVWVGVLGKADIPMMYEVANSLQKIGGSLLLIGFSSYWEADFCKEFNNVYLLGPKPASEVPAYLTHSDIGLMLYDRNKSVVYSGQNPLKLYEYAAAGLAILSTPHREFGFLNPPVIEVNTPEEVEYLISKALEELDSFKQRSLDFSRNHDWANVYANAKERILNIIEKGSNN